jgi:hypothetical protein
MGKNWKYIFSKLDTLKQKNSAARTQKEDTNEITLFQEQLK